MWLLEQVGWKYLWRAAAHGLRAAVLSAQLNEPRLFAFFFFFGKTKSRNTHELQIQVVIFENITDIAAILSDLSAATLF